LFQRIGWPMLHFDVSPLQFVRRLGRRQVLTAGSLALAGWTRRRTEAAHVGDHPPRFGAARRCLLLFLTGGPPQHDTWDPKPDASEGIRGELAPIATTAEGVFLSELFPRLARQARRFRILRSLTHPDAVHATAGYAMLTGEMHRIANRAVNGNAPPMPQDRPNLASTVAHFHRRSADRLPPIALPEIVKDAAVNEVPGQGAGFLGKRFDPLLVEADAGRTGFLPPSVALPVDVSHRRLAERRSLRQMVEQRLRDLSTTPAWTDAEAAFERGFSLVQAAALRAAFDWESEPASVQEAYGTHLFGRGALLARRLLEAGVPFVTVYWHYEGPDDSPVWDTHWNNSPHLRQRLAAPADRAISAVLADLDERGLLHDTLVLCLGEFGRSPRINHMAGRDHWPHVFSALVAGAGIPGGTIYGASDGQGAYPASQPISAEDFGTTVLHLLGVPADYELRDQLGRPSRAGTGSVRPDIFS
jgi:hypothetical protein